MEVPRHWRLRTQRYRLEGTMCRVCGQPAFPPRPVCPLCAALPTIESPALTTTSPSAAWLTRPDHVKNLQLVS